MLPRPAIATMTASSGAAVKYIVLLAAGTLAIGALLTIAVYYLTVWDVGYFVARVLAAPAGFIASFVLFTAYDTFRPAQDCDA